MNPSWKRPKNRRVRGLGDLVHAMANPASRLIDTLAGTDLARCAGCARRRDEWNRRFPIGGTVDRGPEE